MLTYKSAGAAATAKILPRNRVKLAMPREATTLWHLQGAGAEWAEKPEREAHLWAHGSSRDGENNSSPHLLPCGLKS